MRIATALAVSVAVLTGCLNAPAEKVRFVHGMECSGGVSYSRCQSGYTVCETTMGPYNYTSRCREVRPTFPGAGVGRVVDMDDPYGTGD